MADGGRTEQERGRPEEDGQAPARRESERTAGGPARRESGRAPAGTAERDICSSSSSSSSGSGSDAAGSSGAIGSSDAVGSSGVPMVSLNSAEVISVSADASGNEATLPISPMPAAVLPGHILAYRYEVLGRLGEGGMGVVYHCRDQATDDLVALKRMVAPDEGVAADYQGWFAKEARALASLDHPSIVRARDYGRLVDRSPYLVMDVASGPSLHELGTHRLSFELIWTIVDQILGALAHAHARGITHGDLKPSNVLVADRAPDAPHVDILDFGLAWLKRDPHDERLDGLSSPGFALHAGAGTPGYMAPEQIQHETHHVCGATDLYSVGCILYRLLSGAPPFEGKAKDVLRQHAFDEVPKLELDIDAPQGVDDFVMRLLRKRPWDRFDFARDAQRAWETFRPDLAKADFTLPVAELDSDCVLPSEDTRPVRGKKSTRRLDEAREHAPGLLSIRPSPLVGRDDLRRRLLEICGEVSRGEGRPHRLVLLSGPAGVGKSRIAQWLCEQMHEAGEMVDLRARYRQMRGSSDGMLGAVMHHFNFAGCDRFAIERSLIARWEAAEDENALTLVAGAAEWLHPTPPGQLPPLGPSGKRFTLDTLEMRRRVVSRTLRRAAREKPLLFWLDDLQHAAQITLDGLHDIYTNDLDQRILMVGTVRTEGELPRGLRHLVDSVGGEVIEVSRLDDETTRTLLREALPLDPEALEEAARRAHGNPLFALQQLYAWALAGEMRFSNGCYQVAPSVLALRPHTTADFWNRRLDGLAEKYHTAAFAAASLGGEVHRDVLRALFEGLKIPFARVLRKLQDAQVLLPRDDQTLVWPHGLLQEHLLERLTALPIAERVFAKAANALEKHPNASSRRIVRQRVDNLQRAGKADAGAELLFEFIATSWQGAREPKATLRDLDELQPTLSVRNEAMRSLWRAEVLRLLGRLEEAARAVAHARSRFESVADERYLARCLRVEGHIRSDQGHPVEGLKRARKAHALSKKLGDRLGEAQCAAVIGELEYLLGHYDKVTGIVQEGEQIFAELGLHVGRGLCIMLLSWVAHSEGDIERSRELILASRREFDEVGYRLGLAQADVMLAHLEYRLMNYGNAQREGEHACTSLAELGSPRGLAACHRLLALVGIDTDEPYEASVWQQEALRSYDELGDPWGRIEARLLGAQVALSRGDLDGAKEILETARAIEVEEAEPRQHFFLTEAWLQAAAGNGDDAHEALERAASVYEHYWQGGDHVTHLLARLSRMTWSDAARHTINHWRGALSIRPSHVQTPR